MALTSGSGAAPGTDTAANTSNRIEKPAMVQERSAEVDEAPSTTPCPIVPTLLDPCREQWGVRDG